MAKNIFTGFYSIMDNNISFKGINNLYIGKNSFANYGSYVTAEGLVKRGLKNTKYLKLKCLLDDSAIGKDLSEFRESLNKSKCFQAQAVKDTNSSTLELVIKRIEVDDKGETITNSNFTLNGISINPNERKVLPLFTYLAKITRTLSKNPEISGARKDCLNLMNRSIDEEVIRFIDNM